MEHDQKPKFACVQTVIKQEVADCSKSGDEHEFHEHAKTLVSFEETIKIESTLLGNVSSSQLSVKVEPNQNLETNLQIDNGKADVCDDCGIQFTDPDLTNHVCFVHKCTFCYEKFTGKSLLSKHIFEFHPNNNGKNFVCDICLKNFKSKSNLKAHVRTHSGEQPYSCEICGKKFLHAYLLKTHMRIHTGEEPFACEFCLKTFKMNSSLRLHMRIHTGEKPFCCGMCDKSFTTSGKLKVHMRKHTGEKPYSCDVCDKSFKVSGKLKIHMRIHTGERPFSCEVCVKKFNANHKLKLHMRIHADDRPFYVCEICNKKFKTSSGLINHMETHTNEQTFSCEICHEKFKTGDNLMIHKEVHSGDLVPEVNKESVPETAPTLAVPIKVEPNEMINVHKTNQYNGKTDVCLECGDCGLQFSDPDHTEHNCLP